MGIAKVEGGTEVRLFDPRRDPQDWVDLLRPTDCAVFLKDRITSAALTPDGRPYPSPEDTTCIIFNRLDEAQRFCEDKIQALPHLRCEIYDAQGLAERPLMVINHPEHQQREDAGSVWSRRRKLIAAALVLAAGPLFWIGAHQSDLCIFLAINCVFMALRFIYWDFGMKHSERERQKRVARHRKLERGDA